MADYRNKKQNDGISKFAEVFETYTQKFEKLGRDILAETAEPLKIINLTLQDLVKDRNDARTKPNADIGKSGRSVADSLDLVVKGVTDIVSFLYKKPFKEDLLGTASTTALRPFINSGKPDSGRNAGFSGAVSADIGVSTIQRLIRMLEEISPDGYEEQTDIIVDTLSGWRRAMILMNKNTVDTDNLKNFTKASKDLFFLFDMMTGKIVERAARARLGKVAVSSMHSYLRYFADKFGNDNELQKAGVRIGLLNRGLMINVKDFWKEFDEQIRISGNPLYPVRITLAHISTKAAAVYFTYLTDTLLPKLDILSGRTRELQNAAESLKPVTDLFGTLSAIGKESAVIAVSGPIIKRAIGVAESIVKDISSLSDLARASETGIARGTESLKIARNLLIVSAGVVAVAALIGSARGIAESALRGLGVIFMTVASVSLITVAVSRLGKYQSRAGGRSGVLAPFAIVKDMLKASLLTLAVSLGVALLMPEIGPQILKGLLAITAVQFAVVGVGIALGSGIARLGGFRTIKKPFRIIRDLVLCAVATIFAAWISGLLVENQFPHIVRGMGVVLLAFGVIIGSFALISAAVKGLQKTGAKNSVILLGSFVAFSAVTILGMIAVGGLLTPAEITKALAVPSTLLLIGLTFRVVASLIKMKENDRKNVGELLIVSSASAILIIAIGRMITPEALTGVAFLMTGLIGMAYAMKHITGVTKNLFNTKKKVEGFAMFLGSVLAGAAAVSLISVLGSTVDAVSVGMVMICIAGLAYLMKLLGKVGTKKIERGSVNLLIMCGAIAEAAGALYILALTSERFNERTWEAFGMLALCVGGFASMSALLGRMQTEVLKGTLVLAAIGIAVAVNSAALLTLAEVSERYNENTWKAFGLLSATVGAFATMAALMGTMIAPIGLGVIAMTALAGAVGLTALVTSGIIKAVNSVNAGTLPKVKLLGPILSKFIGAFTGIPVKQLAELALKAPLITAAVLPMAITIGTLARAIEDYANLKVAVYEGTRITGYRQLSEEDFTAAADNVSKIISTVGKTILELYYGNSYLSPELARQMFHINLIGHSPFIDVATSCSKMGEMIAKIARGVASYASLRIPLYKGTEITEYRELTDDDFKAAARNITKVVMTVGVALMGLYNTFPAFFKDGWVKKSPFNVMLDSCARMGNMLGKIAEGVQKMSGGTYDRFEGGEKKTVNLGPADFIAAAINVSQVVTTIGTTLLNLYKKHKNFFEDGWIKGSPFSVMLTGCLKMGKMISSFADPVARIASAVYDKYDERGEKTGTYNLTKTDFESAAANVYVLISVLASSLKNSYDTHKDFFDNKDKIQDKIVKGSNNLVKILSSASTAVFNIAKLRIPVYEEGSTRIKGYRSLGVSDFAAASINAGLLITTLLGALENVYNDPETGKLFQNIVGPDGKPTNESVLGRIMSAVTPAGKLLSELARGVSAFAKASVPVYGSDGKIKKYISLTPTDYALMGVNAGLLLTGFLTALKDAYDSNKFMFEGDTVKRILEAMKPAVGLISDITKAVAGMAGGTYTVYDGNGKPRKVNLTATEFEAAGQNVHTLITSIFDALINVSQHELVKDLTPQQAFGPDSRIGILVKITKDVTGIIGNFGDMIGKIAAGVYSVKNPDGSVKNVTISQEDLLKVGPNISALYIGVLSGLNLVVSSEEYRTFSDGKNGEKIVENSKQMKTALQGIIEISDYLEKNKEKEFNPASVLAYNEFIRNFRIETAEAGAEQKINAASGLVKSVNTLDITRANTMIRLLEELNMLSIRLGGLDRFTEVLSETLAVELDKLTRELAGAASVIDKSDKMQKAREDSIRRIVTEINEMLQKPISVAPVMQDYGSEYVTPSAGSGASSDYSSGQTPTISHESESAYNSRNEGDSRTAREDSAASGRYEDMQNHDRDSSDSREELPRSRSEIPYGSRNDVQAMYDRLKRKMEKDNINSR